MTKKSAVPAAGDTATAKDTKPETKENTRRGDDWLISLVALLPTGLAIPTLILGILKNLQPFPHANPEQLLGGGRNKGKGDIASKLSFRYRFEREFSETHIAGVTNYELRRLLLRFVEQIDDLFEFQPIQPPGQLRPQQLIDGLRPCGGLPSKHAGS